MRIHWRTSLVPAPTVIPAPIAYIKVVAVKKLVVGFRDGLAGVPQCMSHANQFLVKTHGRCRINGSSNAAVKYHYSYCLFYLLEGAEADRKVHVLDLRLVRAGRSLSKTSSGWEFGWCGTVKQ